MTFDVIITGGGIAGTLAGEKLQECGFKTAMIVSGLSINETRYDRYEKLGGTLLLGDTVTGGEISDGTLESVSTSNLGSYSLKADMFIMATGKFLGKGLVADMEKIYEPALGLDVEYDTDRSRWFNTDFKEVQPFLQFGVKTDAGCHPSIGGVVLKNVFACGELLAGVTITAPDGERLIRGSAEKVVEIIKSTRDARA